MQIKMEIKGRRMIGRREREAGEGVSGKGDEAASIESGEKEMKRKNTYKK